ncbi:hypothetical protein BLOT_009931 [Blomia tropicalis]|nr:hypothetical protein BLOT_009931 [Blomia tropicalis]
MSDQDDETNIRQLVNYSEEQIDAAINFENEIKNIENSLKSCTNCTRTFPGLSIDNNGHCDPCQKDPIKFTERNNMKISSIPDQLKNLSYIELMLIARFHPIVLIYNEKEQKIAFQIKRDEKKIYDELPLSPDDLARFIFLTDNLPTGFISSFNENFFKKFDKEKFDKDNLIAALKWLQGNNSYYSDIKINYENLIKIPTDGEGWKNLLTKIERFDEKMVEDINEEFLPNIHSMEKWWKNESFLSQTFPHLFSNRNEDFQQQRIKPLNHMEYITFLLQQEDRRFINDKSFCFFAFNTYLWQQTVEVSSTNNPSFVFNLQDISDELLYKTLQSVPSTKAYWETRKGELSKMIDQISMPTIFLTLTAADDFWPDQFRFLGVKNSNQMMFDKRQKIKLSKPDYAEYFFMKRVELFFEHILKPVFNVEHYWYRYEWQSRGRPHIHAFLWFPKDQVPNRNHFKNYYQISETTKDYFRKFCYAINPQEDDFNKNRAMKENCQKQFSDIYEKEEERFDDLNQLVNYLQRPHYGESKKFNIIYLESEIITDINYYNPYITQVWRANTDFKPVDNQSSLINSANYIAKYEKQDKNHNYCFQEILHILFQWPLYKNDEKTNIRQLVNYSQEQIDAAINFENEIRHIEYSLKSCTNCTRTFPGLSIDNKGHCDPCQNDPIKFTERNNMKISSIPDQLKNLSYIELMMITRFHPIVLIYNENEQKIAYQINDEEKIYDELPLLSDDLASFIYLTNNLPTGFISSFNEDFFNICKDNLIAALVWLQENNSYYSNIKINYENLRKIPTDREDWKNILTEFGGFVEDINEEVLPNIYSVEKWWEIGGFLSQTFPHLFPNKNEDFQQQRIKPLNHMEYITFLLQQKDRRFINDKSFCFFAFITYLCQQTMEVSKSITNNPSSVSNLQDDSDELLYKILQSIPSTKAYWETRNVELSKMIDQISMPTIFLTLTAADNYWPDQFRFLGEPNFNQMDCSERKQIRLSKPDYAEYFFMKRVELFFEHILKPVFNVEHYWYRYEWQSRGSPHIHAFLWFSNDQVSNRNHFENYSQINETMEMYFRKFCYAINPNYAFDYDRAMNINCQKQFSDIAESERLDDLNQLLNYFQRTLKPEKLKYNHYLERNDDKMNFYNPFVTQTHVVTLVWNMTEKQNAIFMIIKRVLPDRVDLWDDVDIDRPEDARVMASGCI